MTSGAEPLGRPAPGPAEDEPALLATARSLWPGASVEQVVRGRADQGEHYALLPSARRPQLLVPVRPTAAASAAVRRFSAASSGRDVVTRLAVAGLNRATGGTLLRDRVVVRPGPRGTALRDHLGRALGVPVDVALGVGPERVNRKPVLQVFDRAGRTVAFAKVGDSPQARADVRAETRALRRLAHRRLETLQVPAVLDASTWNGMDVLVVSPLRGRPTLGRRAARRPPVEAMGELSRAFAEDPRPLAELAWWRRQLTSARAVVDADLRRRLVRCLAVLAEEHGRTTVDVGAWHGDWTPWNMARVRSQVMLWDWERFETGVPVGLDVWHHRVQTATRACGIEVPVVLSALQGAGHEHSRAGLECDLYLVAIAGRYAALLDAERGSDIAGPAAVMVRALEARTLRVRYPGRAG
jgi:hypothetical protein